MHKAGEEYREKHAAIRTSLMSPQEAAGGKRGGMVG